MSAIEFQLTTERKYDFRSIVTLSIATLLIGLSVFRMPGALEQVELDWSWSASLAYFIANGLKFGSDVIYTYGPFGMIQASVTAGDYLDIILFGRFAIEMATSFILVKFVWTSRSAILILILVFQIVYFGQYQTDSLRIVTVICVGLFYTIAGMPLSILSLVTLMLPVISLIKFTYFTISIACIVVTGAYLLAAGQWRRALVLVGLFVIGFVFLWFVVLQHDTRSLLLWLRGSAEIATGFNHTMFNRPPPGDQLLLGAGTAMCGLALAAALGMISRSRLAGLCRMLLLFGGLFVAWKQAFVRADDPHMLAFPLAALLLGTLALALFLQESGMERRKAWFGFGCFLALSLACIATLVEIARNPTFARLFSPARVESALAGSARLLTIVPEYKAFVRANLARSQERHALPRLTQHIGSSTVDVFGDEIGIAILNRWNYRPRPIFQSFSSYTSYLNIRNEQYITSFSAPDFYVVRLNTIDGRMPLSTDGPAFDAILTRYEPVEVEAGYLLMRKREQYRRKTILSREARLGEEIAMPTVVNDLRYLRLAIKPTLVGRLRSALLRPAEIQMKLRYTDGAVASFRILPTLAADGILLDPAIRSAIDLPKFLNGNDNNRVVSVMIDTADKEAMYVADRFHIAVDASPLRPSGMQLPTRDFVDFAFEPRILAAAGGPRVMNVNFRDILFVHAPSAVELDVPRSETVIAGRYGVLPGGFDASPKLKEVNFRVVDQLSDGQRQTLYEQTLFKSGEQEFKLPLSVERRGTIRLEIQCAPICDGAWSYWAGIRGGGS